MSPAPPSQPRPATPLVSRLDRLRAHLAGELRPTPPRPAATVLLLRDGPARTAAQVYLLRRSAAMAFAAGMHAFPGGAVDPADADPGIRWAGPPPAVWADRLGCDERQARGYLGAAVRETFEESGVLLAGPDQASLVGNTAGPGWAADRRALLDGARSLADLLAARGLALRSDLLAPWAHWVTPEFEERRYDTWFFVAELPAGQRARNTSGEADRARWLTPAAAVAGHDRGEWAMMRPTRAVLDELAERSTVAEVLATAPGRRLSTVMPVAMLEGEAIRFLLPGDPGYPA